MSLLLFAGSVTAETLSTDFNTNDDGNNGVFFNITAKSQDVYISGFDLNMEADGVVSTYYKIGSHVGSEIFSGDWTYIGDTNTTVAAPITPIRFGGFTIPAGTTYGFYLFSTSNLRYSNANGSNESFSNQDISIFGNRASSTLFSGVTNNVWSGSVHYSVRELTTTFADNVPENGNYINITAKSRDIHISGFDIHYFGSGVVSVYYKKGSYKFSETNTGNWLLLGSATVTGVVGTPTELAVGGLVVPAGETYAFAFYSSLTSSVRVTNSVFETIGAFTFAINENYSNKDLSIFSDTGIGETLFSDVKNDRVWNGRVHYTLPKTLKTLDNAAFAASGHFIDITARNQNVHVSSFGLNINGTKESVDMWYRRGTYKGAESSNAGWERLGTRDVSGTVGDLTELPIGGVTIPAGEIYGFIVHTPNCTLCLRYTSNTSAGNFGNEDLAIFTDTAIVNSASPFTASLLSPRIWNGAVYYSVEDETSCFVSRASNGNAFTFCL